MTTPTLECPKCGRRVPEGAECAACGVVFAKLNPRESPKRTVPIPTAAYQASPRRSPVLSLLGLLAVVALGGFATAAWIGDGEAVGLEPGEVQPAEVSKPAPSPEPAPQPQNRPSPTTARQAAQVRLAALPPLESPAAEPRQAAASEPKPRWVAPDSTWFEGASGFDRGLARARDKNQAALVYFYADWCGYCRQLERDLLDRAMVQEYTKYLVKIRVNPEAGAAERALAKTYGVSGYPSVFVHPAGLGKAKKVRSMTKENGSWRSLSTRDYVERLAAAAGERFGPS